MLSNYLLIDFGSTTIKYAIYHLEKAEISGVGALAFPDKIETPDPLIYEVAACEITSALSTILKTTRIDSMSGIILSVQMHGYLLADADGIPLTPYISWRDKRSCAQDGDGTYYEQFARDHPNIVWHRRGTSCKPNLPLISIYTQNRCNPRLFHQQVQLFTLGSYLAFLLTGNNASHITDCCATGLYDADTGLPLDCCDMILPRAYRKMQAAGSYNGVPVYVPAGDHQVSFLGCGVQEHQLLLNIGTAAQLSTLSVHKQDSYECRPYFDDRILCTVTGLIGGRSIQKNPNIRQQLIESYAHAIQKLPPKTELLVSGGAASHYEPLLKDVCEEIGIPYKILHTNSAIAGLAAITKEWITT